MRRGPLALTVAVGLAVAAVPAHSAWKASGQVTLGAQSSLLGAAGAVTAGRTTTTSIVLTWGAAEAVPGGTIGYFVERTLAGTPGWTGACGTSADAPTPTTGCTDSGLTASTAYEYRVTSVYAKWRKQGAPSGVMTTAAALPPAAGTGTTLRFADCVSGSKTGVGKGATFTSTVQVLNAQGMLVADNPATLSIDVTLTGSGAAAGPVPNLLTVPSMSSVTDKRTSVTMDNGNSNNGRNEFVVTASASGFTRAICVVTK